MGLRQPRSDPGARRIRLENPADFAGFRRAARQLLRAAVPPEDLIWETGDETGDLFAGSERASDVALREGPQLRSPPRVGSAFLGLAGHAALHRDPNRFALVYRLLWRLEEEPRLLSLASDADVVRLGDLAKAVRRDIHKMHAFVRFRECTGPTGDAFVAWYEPDHHIVEAAAPFFAKRFASLAWTILTPERSAHWTGESVIFGPGAKRRDGPDGDGVEELWRSYYANIFNPARVNPEAMRAEMPVRFWRNLPEAALIRDLIASAPERAAAMIEAAPTLPVQRRGAETTETPMPQSGTGLAAIASDLQACRACDLWEHATQAVAGEGSAGARLMLVGEQPGDSEDLAGRPFIGPAGKILNDALADAGVDRDMAYVTNAVKHFKFEPRGKKRIHKRPNVGEIRACRSWLDRELATVEPAVVVMLGASAAQAVLGRTVAVTHERGTPFRLPDGRWAVIATHPSYILRLQSHEEKRLAYDHLVADLRAAGALIADVTPPSR